jgi:hypothetical protein
MPLQGDTAARREKINQQIHESMFCHEEAEEKEEEESGGKDDFIRPNSTPQRDPHSRGRRQF